MDIRAAILRGTDAASKIHRDLHVRERDEGRIDVFSLISAYEVPLLFRPLEGLLGAFLPKPTPGIIVNTKRPLSVRRFTAAHELGHFILGHSPSLDDEGLLRRSPYSVRPSYDRQELEADAFAVALLLPQWLLARHMKQNEWTPESFQKPDIAYQLSLRAGLSYRATCYALKKYRAIDGATCQTLVDLPPRDIKRGLLHRIEPDNWFIDVWSLNERDNGSNIEAVVNDYFRITLLEHSGSGYQWDLSALSARNLEVLSDEREPIASNSQYGGHVLRRVVARATQAHVDHFDLSERRPWMPDSDPLNSFTINYRVLDVAEPGLLPVQRQELLQVA
jgi:hypothetical protein